MAAEAGGTALPRCGDPVLSRASLGQLLEKGLVCSRGLSRWSLPPSIASVMEITGGTGEQWEQQSEISKLGLDVEDG